jgi:hypothetical protein
MAVETDSGIGEASIERQLDAEATRPSGPAAAVILAAGIGSFVLGLLTSLAEANVPAHDWLQFYDRVGPLSGKTIIAAAVFFGAWGIPTAVWRRSSPSLRTVTIASVALIVLGLVGTLPIVFQAFAPE